MQERSLSKERRIQATAVSRGIGIGRAIFVDTTPPAKVTRRLDVSEVEAEIARLHSASAASVHELGKLSSEKQGSAAADIFGVHLLILESSLVPAAEPLIETDLCDAETAVRIVAAKFADKQRSVDDRHIADKYLDVKDVADRLIRNLAKDAALHKGTSGAVYFVADLTPSRLTDLAKHHPKAIVSEQGGWTSHASILARELKLPLVTGVKFADINIHEGDLLIVDGVHGELIVDPAADTLDQLETYEVGFVSHGGLGHGDPNFVATADDVEIVIRANADSPEAYDKARLAGARGIGLYRSEAIFNKFGGFADETTQIYEYRMIAAAAGDNGVRIRTFDVSVEQLPDDLKISERNPSLGLRSIRLGITHEKYFRTQVRAILQAAYHGKIDIVLPMVGGVSDVIRLKTMIDEERQRLKADAIPVGEPLIGAMIEIPSAVLTASDIARHVDLLCLGTNDLVQYLLAVDRDNEAVADWYQTLHPAVLRAIKQVIEVSEETKVPLTVCGEIARSPFYVPLLLGLGARELSMNVNAVSQIRKLISFIEVGECERLLASVEHLETADDIEDALRAHYETHWKYLFPPELLAHKHQ